MINVTMSIIVLHLQGGAPTSYKSGGTTPMKKGYNLRKTHLFSATYRGL